MNEIIDEARHLFKSIPLDTLIRLRTQWVNDCARLNKPSQRRVFSSLAPKLYARVFDLVDANLTGNHIRKAAVNRLFEMILNKASFLKCPCCGSCFLTGEYCSSSCSAKHAAYTDEAKVKRAATNLKRYGARNPGQSKELIRKRLKTRGARHLEQDIKDRREQTCVARYGVPNVGGEAWARTKAELGWIEKYGSLENYYAAHTKKMRASNLARYGVESNFQTEDFQKQVKRTCLEKYGYTSRMHSPEYLAQHSKVGYYKRKVDIQGHTYVIQSKEEERVVRHLLGKGYAVKNCTTSLRYLLDGREHYYHPDFLARTEDKKTFMVEVKSDYTLRADLDKNLKKFRYANKFCRTRGLKFVLCVTKKVAGVSKVQVCTFPTRFKLIKLGLIDV